MAATHHPVPYMAPAPTRPHHVRHRLAATCGVSSYCDETRQAGSLARGRPRTAAVGSPRTTAGDRVLVARCSIRRTATCSSSSSSIRASSNGGSSSSADRRAAWTVAAAGGSSGSEVASGPSAEEIEKGVEELVAAAKAGDVEVVRRIVGEGVVDVNANSSARAGWTALHLGAFYEHADVVRCLLDAKADTEVRNSSGNTPLQFACLKGNIEIASMLLDRGADLYATSNDKGNALDYAEEWGTEEMVEFLLMRAASASGSSCDS